MITAVLIAAALLLAGARGAIAQAVPVPDLTAPLSQNGDLTYVDLIRLVMPGITPGGSERSGPVEIRHIAAWDEGNPEPEATDLLWAKAIPVRSGGEGRLALMLDFGDSKYAVEGVVVLALFDVAGEPRLLDATNVALDRHTLFPDRARLRVSPDNDLLMTRSTHHNSNQNYENTALILVRGDRFELVDTISTFNEGVCAYDWTQQLDVRRGMGEPFADLVATVTERTAPSGGQCGDVTVPEPSTRSITVTYHWDAAAQRYIPDSDAFSVLARKNQERF